MSGIVDTIGVISGVLTIASFFDTYLPSNDPAGATVQVKAGLGDDSSGNLKGTVDHVYAYDFNNNYLGQSGSCGIGNDGGSCQVTVDQSSPGVQADYISIANGNDATCVSWVSVTQYDGSAGGAWTGDIGYWCGVTWYYGNQQAGTGPNGESWRPYCAWFDGDHTNDFEYAALKFTVRAYGELSQQAKDQNQQCSATIFGTDNGPINGLPATPASKRSVIPSNAKRDVPDRLPWMEKRLITSTFEGHTAEEICNSETSWGPDFIGSDGKFCDMGSKTLSPVCDTENVEGCVVVGEKGTFLTAEAGQVLKTYEVLTNWE